MTAVGRIQSNKQTVQISECSNSLDTQIRYFIAFYNQKISNRMLRMRYCVINKCENNAGTHNQDIKMFRIPQKNFDLKNEWLRNIREANHDDYDGNGLVCIKHFPAEKIQMKKNKPELMNNAVPTEFHTEDGIELENNMRRMEDTEFEDGTQQRMLKMRLNFEIKEHKLTDTIKKQSNEIDELRTELATCKAKAENLLVANNKLKDNLLKSQTSTNITVISNFGIVLFMSIIQTNFVQ